ncbi:MAG: TIGR04211 family SH3 domain-containing protein [Gammaproteobacteria bacterium]
MTRFLPLLIALAGVSFHLSVGAAEQVYVIDKLLVGIHEQKNLDSAIIKVLPTGSVLEVLERDGDLALVRDAEQNEGWVDTAYLTADQPAALRLAAIEAEKAAVEQQLAALENAGAASSAKPADGKLLEQLEAMTRENTELKGKLSDERLRAGQLQTEVAALRSELRDQTAPPDARIVELERAREQLQRELTAAQATIKEVTARASLQPTAAMIPLIVREYAAIITLIVLALLALAFGAGAYVVDVMNRRRHGGFRI